MPFENLERHIFLDDVKKAVSNRKLAPQIKQNKLKKRTERTKEENKAKGHLREHG